MLPLDRGGMKCDFLLHSGGVVEHSDVHKAKNRYPSKGGRYDTHCAYHGLDRSGPRTIFTGTAGRRVIHGTSRHGARSSGLAVHAVTVTAFVTPAAPSVVIYDKDGRGDHHHHAVSSCI